MNRYSGTTAIVALFNLLGFIGLGRHAETSLLLGPFILGVGALDLVLAVCACLNLFHVSDVAWANTVAKGVGVPFFHVERGEARLTFDRRFGPALAVTPTILGVALIALSVL